MRLNEVTFTEAQPVEGYGFEGFRVGGRVHAGHMICSHSGTRGWGGYADIQPLLALGDEVDVLFMGTGAEIAHIPAGLRSTLEEAGIGVEVMSTPAACRTYNVLLSEGRRVALAVLAVGAAAE